MAIGHSFAGVPQGYFAGSPTEYAGFTNLTVHFWTVRSLSGLAGSHLDAEALVTWSTPVEIERNAKSFAMG
jgi:hypothetical protein